MITDIATQAWSTVVMFFIAPDGSVSPTAYGLLMVASATAALCLAILAVRQWGARLAAGTVHDS